MKQSVLVLVGKSPTVIMIAELVRCEYSKWYMVGVLALGWDSWETMCVGTHTPPCCPVATC